MPMKFGEFVYRMRENLCATPEGCHLVAALDDLERHTQAFALIANAALKALDFSVDQNTGDVVDPRPAPAPRIMAPEDNSRHRARRRR